MTQITPKFDYAQGCPAITLISLTYSIYRTLFGWKLDEKPPAYYRALGGSFCVKNYTHTIICVPVTLGYSKTFTSLASDT
jgi:hypothetical protein